MAIPIAAIAAILGALGSMTQQGGDGGAAPPITPGRMALGPSQLPLQPGSFQGGGIGGAQDPRQMMMLQALMGARSY